MNEVPLCPHCLSENLLFTCDWLMDHCFYICVDCGREVEQESVVVAVPYDDTDVFNLTDAGRAALQEMPV